MSTGAWIFSSFNLFIKNVHGTQDLFVFVVFYFKLQTKKSDKGHSVFWYMLVIMHLAK